MRRLLIVSAVCLSLFGFAPPEAKAALDNNLCDKGELCIWEGTQMQGCFKDLGDLEYWEDLSYVKWDTCPETPLNDSISSFRNNSSMVAIFHTETYHKGKGYCVYANASSPKIHSDWDNKISSFVVGHPRKQDPFADANCDVRKKNQG